MTKRKHNLVIVSLLFALLLSLVLVLVSLPAAKDDTPSDDSAQTFENLINTTDKKITNVAVKNAFDKYEIQVEEKDDKQVYILSGLDENKTSQSSTAVLIENLINLKATKIIDDENLDLSLYGLNANKSQVTVIFDNGEKVNLILGNEAPLSQGAYVKIEGDSKVYVISLTDTELFLNEKSFYQENE